MNPSQIAMNPICKKTAFSAKTQVFLGVFSRKAQTNFGLHEKPFREWVFPPFLTIQNRSFQSAQKKSGIKPSEKVGF